MSSWREREAETQSHSREDNESTARASAAAPTELRFASFRCECGDEECRCTIRLTIEEYEEVRGYATHFAIARNHENPECEQLIEEHRRFAVVETISREAVMFARGSNPRQWHDHAGVSREPGAEVELLNAPWQELNGGPSPRSCPVCDRKVSDHDHAVHRGGELYHPDCAQVRSEPG